METALLKLLNQGKLLKMHIFILLYAYLLHKGTPGKKISVGFRSVNWSSGLTCYFSFELAWMSVGYCTALIRLMVMLEHLSHSIKGAVMYA